MGGGEFMYGRKEFYVCEKHNLRLRKLKSKSGFT